ncbi:N-acetylglutaminylglutamine amidotransferase [Marinivivus vitaminiproducens]|uniref:N-acetylglutaminylglutamine amidotransferase n=1 Tax=Marinivivus vitaminiproducens TaxID=3035935 RepID=UPI002799A5D7|nr:N-acetylglutaminylglutamine amidotransferase [Geminicoccaceae bacterium SCSIO 64248]
MCGIAGELRFDSATPSIEAVAAMTACMAPRGPDASGVWSQGSVAFGHRRLSIIDLSVQGQQPMIDAALGIAIVFNGCIYNYKELRAELEGKGYAFFSTSDTEVIIKAWHAWGEAALDRFYGMFAFALAERDTGDVVLARDRLGIKPIYVSRSGSRLRFASSLPAILAAGDVDTDIDPVALHHYMTFHAVVPAPRTMLKGIEKLPPATLARFKADGTRTDKVYWRVRYAPETGLSAGEHEERVLASLRRAVDRRLVADVPVGVLLSGGLDSSLIVGLLAEAGQAGLKTFSVGFEAAGGESGDEFRYSDLIAKHYGTDHNKIFVPSAMLLENLPRTIHAMNEPMVSYDNIGFYLLSQEVAKHVKVVQSGQGADEVFGGYHWYPPLLDTPAPNAVGAYAGVFFDRGHDEYLEAVDPRFHGIDHSTAFVEAHFGLPGADRAVDKALRLDTTVMLVDDPVKRVDSMTMAFGLEARVPFLDHELVELAATVPAELKLSDGGKGVLKTIGRKIIPSEVIDRPKGYFPVPALKYIEGPYLEYVQDALGSRAAKDRQLFSPDYVQRLLNDPKGHITPLRGSKLWQVALLELWLQSHGV